MTTGQLDTGRAMILSPGESFGAYTILAPLGRGGMGEVYRARDNRLGRDVALKVLPDEGADDPERIRRFEQEARAASALNHPNIVVIYETGEATPAGRDRPVRFLAMELLDGEPLNALLMGGGLPLKRALDYACQIADGLSRAHESGIVHRDLKPPNIVVTRDGHLKILDFGLAKLRPFSAEDKTLEVTSEPTLTSPGTLLGTVGYMAPEQVRSETATPASDQFGFGCIVFEMLTGQRPFQRSSPAETLSAILRDEAPPIQDLNPSVPAPLRWIVERCLSKAQRDRYASTRDMARDLLKLKESASEAGLRSSVSVALRNPKRRRVLRRVGAALALMALAGGAALLLFQRLRPVAQPAFQRLTFRHGVVWRALFAPHTNSILFTAAWEGQPTRTYMTLPESAGLDRPLEAEPLLPLAYSPDGSEVLVLLGAFRPSLLMSGTLARMPALGGKPRRTLEGVGWADWSRAGSLLAVVRDTGRERVLELRDADGGLRTTLYKTTGAITWVRFSPDEREIAFLQHPDPQSNGGEVRIVRQDGSGSRALTGRLDHVWGLDWNPKSGEIWFTGSHGDRNTLWGLTASGKLRVLTVFPESSVLESVQSNGERCLLSSGLRSGRLVVRQAGGAPRDLSWLSFSRVEDLSPDGRFVLFFDTANTQKSTGAWIRPIEGGDVVHLSEWEPGRFSPDGRWIIGWVEASGLNQLALFPVETGRGRVISTPGLEASDPSFAGPDTILFVGVRPGERKVWRIQPDGTGARPVGAPDCELPRASPSGEAFACEGEAGRTIFVYPIGGGSGRKLYTRSTGGRFWYVRWDRRGERIFAVTRDRDLVTLDAATGRVLSQETLPLPAFEGYSDLITAALTPDGSTQAYTVNLYASGLFMVSGLR
jgi:Tol biopolymer transport system component